MIKTCGAIHLGHHNNITRLNHGLHILRNLSAAYLFQTILSNSNVETFYNTGIDYSTGQEQLGARRPQRPHTAQDHTGMGEILQAALRWFLYAPLGRCHPLLRRLRYRSGQQSRRPR